MKNPLVQLEQFGQSVWYDNVSRGMLKNGAMKKMIEEDEIRGVTSNPSIFQKAIGAGHDYDNQLESLLKENPDYDNLELFEALAIKDIQEVADLLKPVYEKTNGLDGYVSMEVSPELAYNTEHTVSEARKLNQLINKPNVMIKIPATEEGIPAIKQMISEGVNINVTLIFSPIAYENVVEAYISGLEERAAKGEDISKISSVASFFISRIDTAIDKTLEGLGNKELQGKIAIANAKLVYQTAKKLFNSDRFNKLKAKGAKEQRLLWASTSTKNPAYPSTLYVEELIGQNTVNTMPPETVNAYREQGKPADRIENSIEEAAGQMQKLKELGVDFIQVTEELTKKGVELFIDSFRDLLNTIDTKKKTFHNGFDIKYSSETLKKNVEKRLEEWKNNNIPSRLWNKDYTLWKENKEDDKELSNRLGWLELPSEMESKLSEVVEFANEIKSSFDNVVLLGMGGSSLAPEVFFTTFGKKEGYPTLKVLDSTHPAAVKRIMQLDLKKTLFVVSSKSGGTIETMSFFNKFYNELSKSGNAGDNFIALTDPGTSLEKLAKEKGFRKIFSTPAEVGGRFSALTYFGIIPAALIGVDVKKLMQNTKSLYEASKNDAQSEGYKLGALLGEAALMGIDKVTFVTSPKLKDLPNWIEQLVAESTGKEGKGVLPVVNEELSSADVYGKDRMFVNISLHDEPINETLNHLSSKFTVVNIALKDEYDLAKEFYRWEIATAVSGIVLKINPFDQPNVQLAKTLANQAIDEFKKSGSLNLDQPVEDYKAELNSFLADTKEGNYIALLGFVDPSKENESKLKELQTELRDKYKVAVTYGLGPRFLHSTGQLHKGDGNNGYFIQFVDDINEDIEVPEMGFTFKTLVSAQAQGDLNALKNTKRKVLRAKNI